MKDGMEKLLNAIVSKLEIRTPVEEHFKEELNGVLNIKMTMFKHRNVPDEVKEQFKKEFNNHLYMKCKEENGFGYVDYIFEYGLKRPIGKLMEDANDNLAEVLLKLPPLNEGESYELPSDTYMRFSVGKKHPNDEKIQVIVKVLSPGLWQLITIR